MCAGNRRGASRLVERAIRSGRTSTATAPSGICLGLQLLAEALGGKIGVASKPEVGIGEVDFQVLAASTGLRVA